MTEEPTSITAWIASQPIGAALQRIGLIAAGAYLLHLLSVVAYPPVIYRAPGMIVALLLCGILGFGLILAAGWQVRPATRWFILAAYLLGVLIMALKWIATTPYSDLVQVDTAQYMDFATRLLLKGRNPYQWDYSGVFNLYRTAQTGGTPRLDGVMAISSYPYPALSFLLLIPFHLVGLPGAFLVSYIALALLMVVVFVNAPKPIQPLVLIPFVVGTDFNEIVSIGTMDIVWCLLLVWMIVRWDQPLWRAFLFGLAIAFKQNAWLIAPFLLIRLWRDAEDSTTSPWVRLALFGAISGGVFAAFNIPFIMWNPRAWFDGVAVNVGSPLVIFSQGGLASLNQLGFAALPKNYYLLVMLVVLGLLLLAYWRHYASLRHTLWLIPGILLWMTYRNINAYWLYWIFPAIAVLKMITEERIPPIPERRAWRVTLLTSAVVCGAVLAAGVWLAQSKASIDIQPQYPLYTENGVVDRAKVLVTNNTDQELTPRFFVQHQDQYLNPLAWDILNGPLTLASGQTALYTIATHQRSYGFLFHENAQIVVADAGGNYDLRAVAQLKPDVSYLWPEAITNPNFQLWDSNSNAPSHWRLNSVPDYAATLSPFDQDNRIAVRFSLDTTQTGRAWATLQNQVTFLYRPFNVWLYYDPSLLGASEVAYGLEISDGTHQVWVLFGPNPYTGSAPANTYVIQHTLPVATWVRQEIDLQALYAEAGWPLPPFVPTVFRNVEADFQLIWLRLMVTGRSDSAQPLVAEFGPIEQDYTTTPQDRMAQILDDPAAYYVRLGETYERDRNFDRAQEAYEQALDFEPDNTAALAAIEQLKALSKVSLSND